jgi:uncharacterized OB-fold protein
MPRSLPLLDSQNTFFWTGGADGRLRFLRCSACGYWLHPPGVICPKCLGRELVPQAVSGRATVKSYTVNYQSWTKVYSGTYVLVIAAFPEQNDLRMTSMLVGVEPEQVFIGQDIEVFFEKDEDVWMPLFRPIAQEGTGNSEGDG